MKRIGCLAGKMVYEKSDSAHQVVLWMEKCDPERLTANIIMLCTRNIFLLENMRDIDPEEYHEIIAASGSAGIVRGDLKTKGRRI